MISLFFRVYQHLLPRARALQMVIDIQLRQFFEGLVGLPTDARDFLDAVYRDSQPSTTRELDAWDEQFGLRATGLSTAARRTRLAAAWESVGGQSPRYLQDTLRANGFDVFVHQWWELPITGPEPAYVARNPLLYLNAGSPVSTVACGEATSLCGRPEALCGDTSNPRGILLVNKIETFVTVALGCDDVELACGRPEAFCGEPESETAGAVAYPVPTDSAFWPYVLYIGAETFPTFATVSPSRRDEFETLLLTTSPGQQWLGLLVDYA